MKTYLALIAGAVISLSLPAMSQAAPAVFTLDSALSTITISGKVVGTALQEQGAGSLTTHFGGNLNAEVTSSTIRFTGGSAVDAMTTGTWEPGAGGAAGSAPADFGAQAKSLFAVAKAALRNIVFDITSVALPLNNGSFDAAGLVFGFPADSNATLDYNLVLITGGQKLTGLSTNQVTKAATLTTAGGLQKLVIEVDTEYKFKALTANDSSVRFVGQFVATRPDTGGPVPDPLPTLGPITIADSKFVFTVQNAGPNTQLQSSTDLLKWLPRLADKTVNGNQVVFTADLSGLIEFFRIIQ